MTQERTQSPQSVEAKSYSFTGDEINFLQCEVDNRSSEEYEQITGKDRLGRKAVKDDLAENFCERPEVHGLWMATVEAIRQNKLDTSRLRLKLSESLTEREVGILELMIVGKSHSEIAKEVGILVGYAKTHIRQLVQKMGFVNPIQAVAWVASEKKKAGEL